jgi:hypothetical protein
MTAPGRPVHLVGRFFGSLRSRRPTPADQSWIASVLTPAEMDLYWRQPTLDQHHGVAVARRVEEARPGDAVALRAALLHDVGKRHSSTGVIARSVASALALVRIPVTGRWRAYLDHGPLGAADLAAAGSDPLVVEFARHHHRDRPESVPAELWAALSAADGE